MMETRLYALPKAAVPSFAPVRRSLLQRKCACGGTPGPTGECDACRKKKLQRRSENLDSSAIISPPSSVSEVPPIVHEVLRSPGQPLDEDTRAMMEPRFSHDFSHVRVHTDRRAADSARAVNALAYTVGANVVWGSGQYAPATSAGQRLLAHELTHVIQQFGPERPQVLSQVSQPSEAAEMEADQMATAITSESPSLTIAKSGGEIPVGLDKRSPESPCNVALPGTIYRAPIPRSLPISPILPLAWKAYQILRAGSVINNSKKPVTVWRDHFGVYTIAAGARSESDEDVDHIKDERGQWYKIGWNTVTVDATGKLSGYKCAVSNYGEDCPTATSPSFGPVPTYGVTPTPSK
jgi:hypothetical protein